MREARRGVVLGLEGEGAGREGQLSVMLGGRGGGRKKGETRSRRVHVN